jgi:hypothetical protein
VAQVLYKVGTDVKISEVQFSVDAINFAVCREATKGHLAELATHVITFCLVEVLNLKVAEDRQEVWLPVFYGCN